VQDAHDRRRCRDENGSEPWACVSCDCTERLEKRLRDTGTSFLDALRAKLEAESASEDARGKGHPEAEQK